MSNFDQLRSLITWRRALIGFGLLLLGAAGLWLLRTTGEVFSPIRVRDLLGRLGIWGPAVLVFCMAAVLVVPVVPVSALHLATGLAYGPLLGLALVTLADFLGASAGFLLARHWGMGAIERWLPPESQATLERLTQRITWRTVLLLRLLPGPAYSLVSFAAGCSPLGFWTYSLASLAGVLPALALLVFAGDLVTSSPYLAFAIVVALVGSLALVGRMLKV